VPVTAALATGAGAGAAVSPVLPQAASLAAGGEEEGGHQDGCWTDQVVHRRSLNPGAALHHDNVRWPDPLRSMKGRAIIKFQ
jgi:hypothetical protein